MFFVPKPTQIRTHERDEAARAESALAPLRSFSFIRTVTVGFGFTPNLLTLFPVMEKGARGLGLHHPYRRWGFSPRPENIGRPEWTTCEEI